MIDICLVESERIDMCSVGEVVAERGHLQTPLYPLHYPPGLDCRLRLAAPLATQRLRVYVVDLSLEPRGAGCADWVHLTDGLRDVTLCAARRRGRLLLTSTQHSVSIHFHSDALTSYKGLWLYFEGMPFTSTAWLTRDSGSALKVRPSLAQRGLQGTLTQLCECALVYALPPFQL